MTQGFVRIADLRQYRARMTACPPDLRPLRRRNDFGTDLVNGESDEGVVIGRALTLNRHTKIIPRC